MLHVDIYLKTGVKDKCRTILFKDVKNYIDNFINRSGKCVSDFLEDVVGLHEFSGCDTISAFARKGKMKLPNTRCFKEEYTQGFQELG